MKKGHHKNGHPEVHKDQGNGDKKSGAPEASECCCRCCSVRNDYEKEIFYHPIP